jgi:tetratricopeptide (TPR) repeat protein
MQAAQEGIQRVREAVARLHDKAQRQFVEAIRKYPEFRYWEVDWHAGIALSSDPARKDAMQIKTKAQRELAEKHVANGTTSEQAGAYGAALMQFREARRLYPDLPGIDQRIASMETEVKAQRLLERATIEIMSKDFAAARKNMQAAFDLSVLERGTISEMMLDAKRREGQVEYWLARDFELQNQKAEALAAFEVLAAKWPDGLEDEKTRIGALRSDIDNATKELAAGEAAEARGELKEALGHYVTAETFYPGWKDLRERIERLRKALAPPGGS